MAVPCRNQRLFRHIFQSHRHAPSIYETCMSPALSGSLMVLCLEHDNAIEIHNGIIFDFYTGLPHFKLKVYDFIPDSLSHKIYLHSVPCMGLSDHVFVALVDTLLLQVQNEGGDGTSRGWLDPSPPGNTEQSQTLPDGGRPEGPPL